MNMKTFREYLTESVKTYDYRIKIAGELNDQTLAAFEKALAKFDIIKLTKPKKTPVMKSPAGFPELANQEIHIMDATFNYPATAQEVTELWHRVGGDVNKFRMLTKGYDDSVDEQAAEMETSPLLDKDLPKQNAEQKMLSDAHANAEVVIKNSAEGAKFKIAGGSTPPAKTTNDLPMGDESPISGTNKIPTPKSSAR